MGQLFHIQKSKKGVSLIYVIIASAALIILSGVVAVSAMRNMDLTMNSSYSRSAYISDKSAIEFAKGILEQQYEAGSLKSFAVTSGDPYGWAFNDSHSYKVNSTVDGTNCFATCDITPDTTDSNKYTATITAGYPSSETDKKKLLKMVYTTHCTLGGGGFPYIQYGCSYGGNNIIGDSINGVTGGDVQVPTLLSSGGTSAYPMVFNIPVRTACKSAQTSSLQAPQIFFMGGHGVLHKNGVSGNLSGASDDSLCNAALYANSNDSRATIKSNYIYVASDMIVDAGSNNHLYISPISGTGYIYFANKCTVYSSSLNGDDHAVLSNKRPIASAYEGLYSYNSQQDIFNGRCSFTPVTDNNTITKVEKQNNVEYIEDMHDSLACGDHNGTFTSPRKPDWASNGVITGSSSDGSCDVFFYATDALKWKDGDSPTYGASKISFMYVNGTTSAITVGGGKTFKADAVSFCGQKQDGAGDSSDGLTLKQCDGSSKFILESSSGNDVTVTVYHKLVVKKSGGSGYTLTAGTYTVPSGTDLFDKNINNQNKENTFTPTSGSGSGGSSGGGFSGGEYSW